MIKTVSLETAKLLKDNGFSQEKSEKHWVDLNFSGARGTLKPYAMSFLHGDKPWDKESLYSKHYLASAPSTDELLEELPDMVNFKNFNGMLIIQKRLKYFDVYYRRFSGNGYFPKNIRGYESLPEALAQMWLYLKKEGFI